MDWDLKGEYLKEEFENKTYDVLKITCYKKHTTVQQDGVELTEEIEIKHANLYIGKNDLGEICLFAKHDLVTKLAENISQHIPFASMIIQMMMPFFIPLQIKLDVDNSKILELYMGTKRIEVGEDFSLDTLKNSFGQFGQLSQIGHLTQLGNISNLMSNSEVEQNLKSSSNSVSESNSNSESDSESESNSNSESDSESSLNSESDSDSDLNLDANSSNANIDNNNLKKMLGLNINDLESLKGMEGFGEIKNLLSVLDGINLGSEFSEQTESNIQINTLGENGLAISDNLINENKNITTNKDVFKKLKNIWTDKYYENENLDDFLIQDESDNESNSVPDSDSESESELESNLTEFMEFNKNDISMEICLSNFQNVESFEQARIKLNELFSESEYTKFTESCETETETETEDDSKFGISGLKRCVRTDAENGEKYISYNIGSSSDKTFRLKHLIQLKTIALGLIDFVENNISK